MYLDNELEQAVREAQAQAERELSYLWWEIMKQRETESEPELVCSHRRFEQ